MKKADSIHRGIAKAIDLLIVGILAALIPSAVGILAGAFYLLISDGFFSGQSVGKKLIGLRVVIRVHESTPAPGTFRASIVRNLPYAIVVLLGGDGFIGWLLFFTVGVAILGVEAYFAYADDAGIRVGDIFADTQVTDDPPSYG